MNKVALSFGTLALAFLAGCGSTRWGQNLKPEAPAPTGAAPSAAALVSYLNDNANRMQSVQVGGLDLDCYQKGKSLGLRGMMAAQKPRSFRMNANAVGSRVVDLGSNDEEFWFWVKNSDMPQQFYCNYKDLDEGRVKVMPLPIQPAWIMETLGMGPYGPADKYTLESDAATVRLVERTTSPQGKPVRKVIVFNRRPVRPPQPQVLQYQLIDEATGKEVCSARIIDTQIDKKTAAVFPRRVEIHYPEQDVKLALKLDDTEINGTVTQTAFVRQELTGVESLDLARLHLDPAFKR